MTEANKLIACFSSCDAPARLLLIALHCLVCLLCFIRNAFPRGMPARLIEPMLSDILHRFFTPTVDPGQADTAEQPGRLVFSQWCVQHNTQLMIKRQISRLGSEHWGNIAKISHMWREAGNRAKLYAAWESFGSERADAVCHKLPQRPLIGRWAGFLWHPHSLA